MSGAVRALGAMDAAFLVVLESARIVPDDVWAAVQSFDPATAP